MQLRVLSAVLEMLVLGVRQSSAPLFVVSTAGPCCWLLHKHRKPDGRVLGRAVGGHGSRDSKM